MKKESIKLADNDIETNLIQQQDGQIIVHRSQDVAPLLKANKVEANNPTSSLRIGRKFASVPIEVLHAWIEEGIDYRKLNQDPSMMKKFKAKMNDPEWKALRTSVSHV